MPRIVWAGLLVLFVALMPAGGQARGPGAAPAPDRAPILPGSWPMWHFSPGNNAVNPFEIVLTATNVSTLPLHTLPITGGDYILGDRRLFQAGAVLNEVQLLTDPGSTGLYNWTWPHAVDSLATYTDNVYAAANLCPATGGQPGAAECAPRWGIVSLETHRARFQWQIPLSPMLQFCCQPITLAAGKLFIGIVTGTGPSGWIAAVGVNQQAVLWRTPFDHVGHWASGVYRGKPALYADDGGVIDALDMSTGQVVGAWTIPDPGTVTRLMTTDDGHLYVMTTAGQGAQTTSHVYQLDGQGNLGYTITTTGGALTFDAGVGSLLYGLQTRIACSGQNCQTTNAVVAYQAGSGLPAWQNAAVCGGLLCGSPSLANNLVYVAANGTVSVLDGPTGALIATLGPSPRIGATPQAMVTWSAVFADGVYFGKLVRSGR